jgi:hypothetical protein
MDKHLKERNRTLFFLLLGIFILLYIVSFVKMKGNL